MRIVPKKAFKTVEKLLELCQKKVSKQLSNYENCAKESFQTVE